MYYLRKDSLKFNNSLTICKEEVSDRFIKHLEIFVQHNCKKLLKSQLLDDDAWHQPVRMGKLT